jgi:hypothetical protein
MRLACAELVEGAHDTEITMARMLTLHFKIKNDAASQGLAHIVKDGFRYESWRALLEAGNVYDARITALPHPDNDQVFSSILLCTVYDGLPEPYQHFFWSKLSFFFVAVGFAAAEPPFEKKDLTPEQAAAFEVCQGALAKCEQATAETFDATQAAFKAATRALSQALDTDEDRKDKKEIEKTKFELFTEWVNLNDLTYKVGSPALPDATSNHDLRVPPVLNERSNFLNPACPSGPFPVEMPSKGPV